MPELVVDLLQALREKAPTAFGEVIETMAFLCAAPVAASDAHDMKSDGPFVRLSMRFKGPITGTVDIVSPEALGAMMVDNMLSSDAAGSVRARRDALLEALNMTCGVLFRDASLLCDAQFEIGLPQLQQFDAASQWLEFISSAGTTVLDVEGVIAAISVACDGDK
jgi:hypothetical protein